MSISDISHAFFGEEPDDNANLVEAAKAINRLERIRTLAASPELLEKLLPDFR